MGKHSQPESAALLAIQQYEQLVAALRHHKPGERTGLCLACGTGWPCVEVWLPLARGRLSRDLQQTEMSPERQPQQIARSEEP